jgi:hypothetical protein
MVTKMKKNKHRFLFTLEEKNVKNATRYFERNRGYGFGGAAFSGYWLWSLILFCSCNKKEPVPAYIHIDKIALTTLYPSEGSSSNKITDAWIYIDDQLVGAYEMPCTIPVLYSGTHVVKVLPGIKENGISDSRIPYPFYNRFEQVVSLTSGDITTLSPATTYSPGTKFSWIEDFEGVAMGICGSNGVHDSIIRITKTPTEVFELSGSGRVMLNGTQMLYLSMSCNKFALPQAGTPVFLELNYNCNTIFNIGVMGYSGTNSIDYQGISLSLLPTNGWNKVYVNLTTQLANTATSAKFSVFFSMVRNQDIPASFFYIDNVKLLN